MVYYESTFGFMDEAIQWDPDLALLTEIEPHVSPYIGRELYDLRMRICGGLAAARAQVSGDRIDELCNLALVEVSDDPNMGDTLTRFCKALYTQLEYANAPVQAAAK